MNRLLLEKQDGIATVTLNRPDKRNPLDLPMFQAIDRTIRELKCDRSVRAIIIRGEGEDFCSGLDIKSVLGNPLTGLKLLWKWLPGNANLAQRVSVGWRRLPVPVIAAIHGRCCGVVAEQARVLDKQSEPLSGEQLAAEFKGAKRERVTQLLDTLVIMGRARKLDDGRFIGTSN